MRTGTTTCKKCEGTGRLAHFSHVDFGRCWACAGQGVIDHDAIRAHNARRRQADTVPTITDLEAAATAAGHRVRAAIRLARAYQAVAFAEIWDDAADRGVTPEVEALAAEMTTILSGRPS